MPLADKPIDLSENDYLGTKEKAEIIKDFVKHPDNRKYLRENNMIVLYGNWGSGKSSIIRYIHNELNKEENFISIIFDAWLYEKDNNLPYSLLEFILDKLEKDDRFKYNIKVIKDKILKAGFNVFSGILKGFSINLPIISYNPKDTIGHFEKINEIKSHYREIEELRSGFKFISDILKDKTLVVFIDELDRCEPEHILDLLASIKLFFAYGENIIYFVAIDRDAVTKAIETKYRDIIKAEEYLEKIFNISFSMPKFYELKEFIKQYEFFNNNEIAEKLERFFKAINFTNPRHLKKILNKYELLVRIKNLGLDGNNLIPEIIRIENGERKGYLKGYLFDTVFVLYFIILYEFYYEKYLEVKNYDVKLINYSKNFYNREDKEIKANIQKCIDENFKISVNILFSKILNLIASNDKKEIFKIINVFTPQNLKKKIDITQTINGSSSVFPMEIEDYLTYFDYKNNEIIMSFCKYLISEEFSKIVKKERENYNNENYPFTNLFKMVETYL